MALWRGQAAVETPQRARPADLARPEHAVATIAPWHVAPGRSRPDDPLLAAQFAQHFHRSPDLLGAEQRRFRRLYLAGLEQLYGQGHLTLAGRCRERAASTPWQRFLADVRDKAWVVDAKQPLREPQHVLTYLARYTHRVAIANHRLIALDNGQVTFRSKAYQRGHRLRTQTLEAVEFLRRLMLHVPPHGFPRRRHFGFLANRVRQEKLVQCRTLLGHATQPHTREEAVDLSLR